MAHDCDDDDGGDGELTALPNTHAAEFGLMAEQTERVFSYII